MSKFIVETSARHVHLSQKDIDTLFGAGYQLTNKKDLSQPGQFACEEKVEVIGPKGSLKMSILGPARPASQVEISFSDARALGLVPPVRESGDTAATPGCTIKVGDNVVTLDEGVIVAKRHIHMTTADAAAMGLVDKQIVSVKVPSDGREVIFGDVVVRVSDKYALAMHIDTDESNAGCVAPNTMGEIIK
ncbi:MAG: phosphate propanoyltransferase [Clostridia bacterium]|nr:phosphate propanoyltransferase [Clostridia bacterium]